MFPREEPEAGTDPATKASKSLPRCLLIQIAQLSFSHHIFLCNYTTQSYSGPGGGGKVWSGLSQGSLSGVQEVKMIFITMVRCYLHFSLSFMPHKSAVEFWCSIKEYSRLYEKTLKILTFPTAYLCETKFPSPNSTKITDQMQKQ